MYLPKLSIGAIALLSIMSQSVMAAPAAKKAHTAVKATAPEDTSSLNACTNSITVFNDENGTGEWKEETNAKSGWSVDDDGLELVLEPPQKFVRLTNASDYGNPYNEFASPNAPNFIAPQLLHYGKVTYQLKTSGVAGAVTAAILMAPGGGDEIDFEMLGGDRNKVQTNYFYAGGIVYGVNGGDHDTEDTAAGFHNYTIDWSPEQIQWLVDGTVIRTTTKKETCNDKNVCSFPSHPTSVQVGLWDSSDPSSTAEWAKGPINWNTTESVTAVIKSVSIECNPEYNQIA
ncbi:concanavalin A-like lectin/glucanase domain-containing protein [Mucor mucedo]|uniref:concanavalin A-like lectin/glucanase domain-containing protein n=1 Tax=Mucor mucedo TaxID=29922 RepID=UPI00221ED8C0|nr:concanavalin A-like lectin/glucanase domain-containing protein [Mucor mucedo]KAI7878373.1 concanavalin A-like lectin/glucanase domain-containing protein [Mucor mucedo]